MNLPNLERILSNPDLELKAQLQNQMRTEQLKQEIDKALTYHIYKPNYNDIKQAIIAALNSPSILSHADSEVMAKAGWIRQEDYQKAIDGLKKCMDNPDFPRSFAQATLIDLKELSQ